MARALLCRYHSRLASHQQLLWLAEGEAVTGLELPRADAAALREFPRRIWNLAAEPRVGRFYPARLLPGRWSMPVFRVLEVAGERLQVDLNLAAAYLQAELHELVEPDLPAGLGEPARLLDWLGMECPLPERDTDFTEPDAFDREDEEDDARFYQVPRPLLHVDSLCARRIAVCYERLLPAGARVLDLMSGWRSHLPAGYQVTGVGMNEQELADNPDLQEYRVQDLNRVSRLPFVTGSFDAVINTVSIEYLTQPDIVLAELRRVLRPGGRLVISFSNRFFPTKAISLWRFLHPMERLGWVLQRLAAAGFLELHSHLERGLPRPPEDRHSGQMVESDPLFVAWGRSPENVHPGPSPDDRMVTT